MTDIEATGSLFAANKTAKDLEQRVEESNAIGKSQIEDLEKLRVVRREDEEWDCEDLECEESDERVGNGETRASSRLIWPELRNQAAKEMKGSMSKREFYLSSAEALTKEIEGVNEEELRPLRSTKKSKLKQKIKLKNTHLQYRKNTPMDWNSATLLESALKELAATEKELEQVKEGSFQFMASMDIIRDKLKHVTGQTARLKKEKEESEIFIHSQLKASESHKQAGSNISGR
ncbi:hypothetical protein SASPL_146825 [Salvia splendens]|uniref:Uncharacterized protein n=1 Tax=Salvia splendens TaxID=180675 RepID=A0A8X8WDD7_SALSN|nr:hypothetical protein SASPL_146825 [Salvia splendens]